MKLPGYFAATTVVLLLYFTAFAYPIPPQPLRQLCAQSQVIVVARVEGSKSVKDPEGYSITTASLKVSSILKGEVAQETLDVMYSPGMICPAPPEYPIGSTVIAFLDRAKRGNAYVTNGLSYGSKVVTGDALRVYTERIREILEIFKQDNNEQREKAIVEWLVRCAEDPATRWEGAYELAPAGDFMSFYDRGSRPDFASHLTEEQKSRLSVALLSSPTISGEDLCLIALLKDREGDRLAPFIMNYLKTAVDDPPYYAADLMAFISARLTDESVSKLAKDFSEEYAFDEKARKKRKAILMKFIAEVERAKSR